MNYKIRLLNVLPLYILLSPHLVQSQIPTVKARPMVSSRDSELAQKFRAFQTYQIGSHELIDIVRNDSFGHRMNLELPGYGVYAIDLFENPMQSSNYLRTVNSEHGETHSAGSGIVKTFRGNLESGQYVVSLTIDHDFVQGFIQLPKGDKLQIEPLRRHLRDAPSDAIIVYRASDQIHTDEVECGVKHSLHRIQKEQDQNVTQRSIDDCRTVQIAFANDWLMFEDHENTVVNVENHNMAVINDVQNNYDTEFSDDLTFEVVQIWVSTCSTCDPWSNSADASTLLNSFTNWGPSGFSNTHDVANLWTDRDFDGQTVGIAWLEAVCSPFRYLTCQDFLSNAGTLRALLAHEMGHSFGADHDPAGSNTIMAPSLVVTNNWSATSITQINNYLDDINCLSLCSAVQSPDSDFSADATSGCEPLTVHYFDESTGNPTSWEWTFQSGTPSSSTLPNPTVTYQNSGTFDVVLEVSNSAGTDTRVRSDFISVFEDPVADFIFNQIDLAVIFTNLSQGADSYFWDFGDGSTSTQENPIHNYGEDGEYEVSLEVDSDCGTDTYILFIDIFTEPIADFDYSTDEGCTPLVVQYFNESTDNVQFFNWIFTGGTPATSFLENPVVTYSSPGNYPVTLIVENVAGVDNLTINNLIEVHPQPESDFNVVVNGLSVQFVNLSEEANAFFWTFGDGGTSISESPNHTYSSGGSYQVTLESTNACGSDMHTEFVVLNTAPVADFISSISSGCAPLSVTFTSTSQGTVTSYNWSFPGGIPSSSNAAMPTVIYPNAGTYDVQLTVGNAVGSDALYLEDLVSIYTNVTSGFIADINGTTVDLVNTSTGASNFNWQIDGTTFIDDNLSYTFPEDGTYLVRLIAFGLCGSDTTIQNIHITTPPTAGIASNIISGCEPLLVQFFNLSSTNANAFEWVFEGGTPSVSSEENPQILYTQAGVYDVQLTVWSESGTDVLQISELITIDPLPVSAFSTMQNDLQMEFVNASFDAEQFFWDFGDGMSSMESNPVHTYEEYGSYTITLIAENDCGSDEMTINLQLSGAPVPMFVADQTSGCIPFEVQFIEMSQNDPTLWEWSFPGGLPDTSTLRNPVIVYDQPGIYRVVLRVSNAVGAQAMFRDEYIHVANSPDAGFIATPNAEVVTFTNQSQEANKFFWFFGDGAVDTAAHPVHEYDVSGTYQVRLLASNVCNTDTMTQDVTVLVTSLGEPGQEFEIGIFPNPNPGVFTLLLDGTEEDFEFELDVHDLLGRTVLQTQLSSNASGLYELSLENAPPGVYAVILRKGNFKYVTKMVVF